MMFLSHLRGLWSSLSSGLVFWVLAGAAFAYLVPAALEWTRVPILWGQLFQWMFALTMFAVGTVIETKSFVAVARSPGAVALGVLTQFTVMPLLAWVTARAGGFDRFTALGFIIVGCAPGAMTSNVLTYLARGDTAYSVTLTTVASILAVVVTPSLVFFYAGESLPDALFWSQLVLIAWTVAIPLVLGIALRRFSSRRVERAFDVVSPGVAGAAIVVICSHVIAAAHDKLAESSLLVFAGVAILNALGYACGYILGRLYRLDRARRVALTIEIGMQNAGLGVVLAATFEEAGGSEAVAVPAALFTIWCIVTAAGLIAWLGRRESSPRHWKVGPDPDSSR